MCRLLTIRKRWLEVVWVEVLVAWLEDVMMVVLMLV